MTNWGIVVGDAISPVPAGIDLDDLHVRLEQDGREAGSQHARGHIDDHFLSLSRLVRQLARFDRGLEAGQHVITGAFVRTRVTGPPASRRSSAASGAPPSRSASSPRDCPSRGNPAPTGDVLPERVGPRRPTPDAPARP